MNDDRFATELLHEVKLNVKRWFIIAMVELAIIVALAGTLAWALTLPVEESATTTQELEGDDNTDINQIGGDYYGESKTN